ncbi:MAG: superoxide dismutase family protein [Melioribacteraceae bacterium]|nr:superoxide dismutase family protein [Melioribacteraceae bacterium]MCF8263409.1 superoxide dismutase family protein [Melioribacteraceae bacterium]MCF8430407.1 superoxide dismutase family protein [Melioribacteraceae bacterium]
MILNKIKYSFFVTAIFIIGCNQPDDDLYDKTTAEFRFAVAEVQSLYEDGQISGVVNFNLTSTGVEVIADIKGLPRGEYGFHIHQFGDLRSDDGSSLGGHFNPGNKPHGEPGTENSHAGDLPNIVALNDSVAQLKFANSKIGFSGKESIIGRAVVIHAMEDDYNSQPSGNAGQRIAAGIIGIANDKVY